MNLETEVNPKLWGVVAEHYEAKSYKNAILDALHYLTDIIRDKADVEGDGARMVNAAFGGTSPRIRINKLQSQSEKDAQVGILKLLEGLYIGIRNPRSHEQTEDKRETADTIILLINYILSVIDTSKGPFVLVDWLNRVYDPDFYPSARYADILVGEIPPKRYTDTFIELYRSRQNVKGQNIRVVFESLIKKIGEDNIDEVLDVMSNELRTETNTRSLTHFFQCFPANLWPRIAEDARLRIENKLLQSVKYGAIKPMFDDSGAKSHSTSEPLGTWISNIIDHLTPEHKSDLYHLIYDKCGTDATQCAYVIQYFLRRLPEIEAYVPYYNQLGPEPDTIIEQLYSHYRQYSPQIQTSLDNGMWFLPKEWQKIAEKEREKVPDEDISPEDIPF